MSDDIFYDIWKKLADIYDLVRGAVASAFSKRAINSVGGGKGILGGIGDSAGKLFGGISSAIKTSLRGASAAVSRLASLFGAAGKAALGIGGALISFTAATYAATRAQLESQRKYALYNAELARSFAISDIQDIFRNIAYASDTAASTVALNEAYTQLKDALLTLQTKAENATNYALEKMSNAAAAIVRVADKAVDGILDGVSKFTSEWTYWFNNQGRTYAQIVEEQKRAIEEERLARERAADSAMLPAAQMFANIANRNWGAVIDTRPPLF